MKRMAIICSTDFNSWPMGGMLYFLHDIIPDLSRFFEIELWGVNTNTDSFKKAVLIGNKEYPIHYFSMITPFNKKLIPNIIKVAFDISRMKRSILNKQYDILYYHGLPLEPPFLLGSKSERTYIVSHIHGTTNPFAAEKGFAGNWLIQNMYEILRKFVIKKSALIFLAADTPSHKEFSSKFSDEIANKIIKIHNFASPRVFYSMGKKEIRRKLRMNFYEKIVIYTCRFSYQKDPFLAINTFKMLTDIYKEKLSFFMIGDGPLLSKCKTIVSRMNIANEITFWGKQNRETIAKLLNASDVYLYTSHGNGVPLSVVEALMCGLCIVTPDIPGVHDMVVNGETGYIVSDRDPEKLAMAVNKVLNDGESMRERCIVKANAFSPEKAAKKIADSIERLWE